MVCRRTGGLFTKGSKHWQSQLHVRQLTNRTIRGILKRWSRPFAVSVIITTSSGSGYGNGGNK